MNERSTPKGFWAVWTAVAMDLLGFGIIIPLLPLYAERFGAGPVLIGMLFASYSLSQFLLAPVWGKLSDRVGRKPVLLLTIAGSAIGSLMLGLAGSLVALFAARIVDGASGASVAVARATVADVAEPSDRPRLMGLLGAAFGIGFVLGPALGGAAALFEPSTPFFVAAVVSTINLVITWRRLPETRKRQRPLDSPEKAPLPRNASRLVLITFVGVVAFSAFETTFALLSEERLALSDSAIALIFAGLGVVLVATQGALVGPVTRRVGEMNVIRLGLWLNVVGFLLLALGGGWSGLVSGLVCLAVGQGLLTPNLSSAISGIVPNDRVGYALGVQQSAGGLARVVGPLIGGSLFALAIGLPYLVAAGLTLAVLPWVPSMVSTSHGSDQPSQHAEK